VKRRANSKQVSVLSVSTCNLTKPYLTKNNIPCPDPAGGSFNLAQPGATLSQPKHKLPVD